MQNFQAQLRAFSYARYLYPSVLALLLVTSAFVAFGMTLSGVAAPLAGREVSSNHADFQLVAPDGEATASAN